MAQVQCPNCGGYKVSSDTHYGRKLYGKEQRSKRFRDPLYWMGVILDLAGLALLVPGLISGGVSLPGILLVICGIVLMVISERRAKQAVESTSVSKVAHECLLCGYTWTWQPGQIEPKVTVRPELIQQGEQKLAEEARKAEEERRRVAADYWYQQQQKRK